MKIKSVSFADGYRRANLIDPKVAYRELEKIRMASGGELTPDAVVDAVKSEDHLLHGLFTWDDTKAAREYRKEEARLLSRSIKITFVEAPEAPVKEYQVVTKSAETEEKKNVKVYRSTMDILADPVLRAELLSRALRELVTCQRRFRGLQELVPVFRALDEVLETMEGPT